jgi:hypothetical protein
VEKREVNSPSPGLLSTSASDTPFRGLSPEKSRCSHDVFPLQGIYLTDVAVDASPRARPCSSSKPEGASLRDCRPEGPRSPMTPDPKDRRHPHHHAPTSENPVCRTTRPPHAATRTSLGERSRPRKGRRDETGGHVPLVVINLAPG